MKKLLLPFFPALIALVLVGLPVTSVANGDEGGDDFDNALHQLRDSRQAFKDAKAEEASEASQARRETAQARKAAAEQRREDAGKKMEEKRKETLLRLVDIQVKHWEKIAVRVEGMPNITDDLKAQLAAEVDAAIAELNVKRTSVEGAEGREAIKTLAKEIRDSFRSKRDVVKNIVEAIHASRGNSAAAKAEDRAAGIKAKIQELKGQGKNTTEIENELEEAEEDIDDAQEAIGRKAFREANEDLKGAYQKFRDIAQKAKNL